MGQTRSFLTAAGVILAVVLAGAALALSKWGAAVLVGDEVLHTSESRYQNIYVTREGDVVTLRAGSLLARSSAMDWSDPYRHVIEYTEMMMVGTGYVDDPQSALVVGLGGGTVTKYLRRYFPEMRIVSVEFDEEIVPLAEQYFDFVPDQGMEIVVMDGRRYLAKTREKFDLIFLDAFHGDYIPFHLMTREFLQMVQEHLTPQGVVVSNTWSSQKLSRRESATYAEVFGHFDSYMGRHSANRIIVAKKNGGRMDRDTLHAALAAAQERIGYQEINLPLLFQRHYRQDEGPFDEPLVDDFAPVNLLIGE
ncbi:MAG: spermidine synthase [Desulfovibrionales bacterium]